MKFDTLVRRLLQLEGRVRYVAIPPGGLAGQVLMKRSSKDFDLKWGDISVSVFDGGTAGAARTSTLDGGLVTASYLNAVDAGGP